MAGVLRQDGCKGFLVYSIHLPTASLHGERKRTRALIPLSNLDSFSPFTGNLIVFLAIKEMRAKGKSESVMLQATHSALFSL